MAIASSKKRKCVKGWSCGATCLSREKKNCRNGLDGEPKKLADWLEKQAKPAAEVKKKDVVVRPLPDDVYLYERGNGERVYTFDVDGADVDFATGPVRKGQPVTVLFSVAGMLNEGNILDAAAASSAAKKIFRIMQHDASTRPDGFEYETAAFDMDGKGAERAHAYEKIAGFSRPVNGAYGKNQYGIVRDGRITPNTEKVEGEDTVSKESIQESLLDANEERRSNRRARQS